MAGLSASANAPADSTGALAMVGGPAATVPIKPSSQHTIDALARDLASDRAVTRDTAIARLAVIGSRAVPRLSAIAIDSRAAGHTRAAALRALETIGDARALDAAASALRSAEPEVIAAAISVARSLLAGVRGAEAVELITAAALDVRNASELRRGAAAALADLRPSTVAPVFKVLSGDADPRIAAAAASASARGSKRPASRTPLEKWLVDATIDDPEGIRREVLAGNAAGVSLAALHRLVQALRERGDSEKPARRAGWTAARAAVHAELAARGSRVALYDLRETLEAATEPLPADFITALTGIGDGSCLEPIAAAYARAVRKQSDDWWRRHLLAAFHEIVRREKITPRNAAMKRIQKRWPQVLGGRG